MDRAALFEHRRKEYVEEARWHRSLYDDLALLEHRLKETYAEMLYVYHLYHEKILSPQWIEMSDDRKPWLDRAEKELHEAGLI